jgi:hypothetical protein
MTSRLLVPAAILFLTVAANAQLHSGMPAPMPGVPMTPPPVDHPALGAQPWFNNEASKAPAEPAKETKDPAKKSGKKVKDPDPAGLRVRKSPAGTSRRPWMRSRR